MKTLSLCAALSLAPALAQSAASATPYLGANITRVYSVDQLMTRPGLLTLGKGDMFMLDFPADVTAVVTPQAAMMDIPEPLGNVVVMTAKVSSGKGQVFVQLENGKYATFLISFTPGGNGMKRVKVTDEPGTDASRAVPAPPTTAMPAYTAPVMGPPIPIPPAVSLPPLGQDIRSLLAPVTSRPPPAPTITRPQPDWLRLSTRLVRGDHGDVLSVQLTNGGARPLVFSGNDARVTLGGLQVLAAAPRELRVPPGETRGVELALTRVAPPGGAMTLDWPAFDAAANAYYRVSHTF